MEDLPDELTEGEQIYDEASERMKAHIDAEAELRSVGDGEPRPGEVVELVKDVPGIAPYSESYIIKLRDGNVNSKIAGDDYLKAIQYRETYRANDHASRERGNVTYEGPPLDMTMQHITERPITEVEEVNRVNGTTIAVTFEFELDDVFRLIREADEDDAKAMFDAVIDHD